MKIKSDPQTRLVEVFAQMKKHLIQVIGTTDMCELLPMYFHTCGCTKEGEELIKDWMCLKMKELL